MPVSTSRRHNRRLGFTLIEMMVGIALGLIVLAVLTAVFVGVSNNRRDMERTGRQIENGRFAIRLLADDIVNAGYFGEFDPRDVGPPRPSRIHVRPAWPT
jgi:type IV pilus assembly protein PilW